MIHQNTKNHTNPVRAKQVDTAERASCVDIKIMKLKNQELV